jgi:uncharacterized lipoprotein YddW (UPF0748 family)
MIRTLFLFSILNITVTCVFSQSNQHPKREMRGVWIASVANIDWPSKPSLTPDEQRAEFEELITLYKRLKFNAVFVQIRPAADAFYSSPLEPWSPWLSGKTGVAPQPYYDPLEFMIQTAHKHGVEFHAWLNPYRAVVNVPESGPDSASLAFRKPEWFVKYGKNLYFNPGLPEVRNHVTAVIMDIIKRYSVDGIHFDDYFYPYKINGEQFADSLAYSQYNETSASLDDWRRSNVDKLIETLSDSIQSVKPYVKFGISPFGVWRNKDKDPTGSDTKAGQTCYDDLYADVLKWLMEGWIDYVAPQLYWSIGFEAADYKTLANWWNQNSYGKPVYIGQAAYRVNAHSDERWKQPSQLFNQIRLNRSLPAIKGNIFFSAKSLKINPLGVNDTLINNVYKFHALIPPDQKENSLNQDKEVPVYFTLATRGVTLHWPVINELSNSNPLKYYVIYRFKSIARKNFEDSKTIISIVPSSDVDQASLAYTDESVKRYRKYYYCIRSVNRYNHESLNTTLYGVKKKRKSCVVGF